VELGKQVTRITSKSFSSGKGSFTLEFFLQKWLLQKKANMFLEGTKLDKAHEIFIFEKYSGCDKFSA